MRSRRPWRGRTGPQGGRGERLNGTRTERRGVANATSEAARCDLPIGFCDHSDQCYLHTFCLGSVFSST